MEVSITMVLEKCCPDKNIGDLDVLSDIVSVGFTRSDGAKDAATVSDRA
jgi:hypothetical protein